MNRGGKVVISVFALFILLVSISSYFVFATETNTKSYDSSTRTVTIISSNVEIAKIKLDTPTVYNVIPGRDRLVAEFTINNSEVYNQGVLDKMKFYNVQDNNKSITRTFTYKYKVLIGTREIPEYDKICLEDIVEKNGSISKNCSTYFVGMNKENIHDWKEFKPEELSSFKSGLTTIGIYTDVLENDYVEWVPTLYGVEITEWGIWVDSFNNGLVAYYSFDPLSEGLDSKVNDVAGLTLIGTMGTGVNGKRQNGTLNSGNQCYSTATAVWNETYFVNGVTMCAWTNFTGNEGAIFNLGGYTYMHSEISLTGRVMFGGAGVIYPVSNRPDGSNYAFVCGSFNKSLDGTSGKAIVYFNGVNEATGTQDHSWGGTNKIMYVGGEPGSQCGRDGAGYMFDEFMLWNRTLTTAEISSLYDSGTGTFYEATIDNPPTITLNSPENYANFSANPVAFNCTAQDDKIIQNVSLWINGEINYTLTDGVDNYTELYIERTWGDGIYNWTCSAYDSASQIVGGINRTLMIDTIPPQTTIPIITPQNPTTNDNLQCYATLTDNIQTNLTAYWKWYKNGVNYLSGTTESITDGANSLITMLDAGNTTRGENWICEITPYDGINYGNVSNSTAVTILNSAPFQNNPLLSTPSGKNFSYENLTCYNQSTSDADKDIVTNIYNWYKNNQPWAVLNIPLETSARDYSGNNNNGTIYGNPQFVTGIVGKALSFDGVDDYVEIPDSNSLDLTNTITIESWIKGNPQDAMILDKNSAYRLWFPDGTGKFVLSLYILGSWTNIYSNTALSPGNWYHLIAVYNGSNVKLYLNGVEDKSQSISGAIGTSSEEITIGKYKYGNYQFNGTIDEVKVYHYALTPEQISADYNLEYNKVVNQETTGGDNYMCQITPNDGEVDGTTLNSSVAEIKWAITFNVRDSYSNVSLNGVTISCNYTGFNQLGDTTNPYGPYGFPDGNWECNLTKFGYYTRTQSFLANEDKTVDVKLSEEKQLTVEEHTWLEAVYNCLYSGDCSLYNLLLEVNQTVGKIWEQTRPTDNSVITNENVTNKVVDSSHNLTIDYTVNIPLKAGYSLGAYLPMRIGFWFMNEANTTCYNQGDKPTGVEEPYCQPLIIETLGPMGGSVSFTVKLHPELSVGNYSIKRIIDIDPNNVWINYGQEAIGSFVMAESLSTYGIGVEKTGENNPSVSSTSSQQQSSSQQSSGTSGGNSVTNVYSIYNVTNVIQKNKTKDNEEENTNKPTGITGGIIRNLLPKGSLAVIIEMSFGLIALYIISKTIIKLKKK